MAAASAGPPSNPPRTVGPVGKISRKIPPETGCPAAGVLVVVWVVVVVGATVAVVAVGLAVVAGTLALVAGATVEVGAVVAGVLVVGPLLQALRMKALMMTIAKGMNNFFNLISSFYSFCFVFLEARPNSNSRKPHFILGKIK
jgi:hypothetical protein